MATTHRRSVTGDRVLGLVLLLLELVAAAAAPTEKEGPQGNFPLQSACKDCPENYGQNNKRLRLGTAQMPVYRPQPSTYGRPVYRPQPSTYGTAQMPVYRPQPSTYGKPVYRPQPSTYGRPVYRPQPSTYGRPVYRPQPSTYGTAQMPVYRPQPSMYGRPVYRPQPSTYGTAQMPVYRPQPSTYGRPVYRPQPSTYGTAQMPVYRPQPSTYGRPVYRPQPSTYDRLVYRPQPSTYGTTQMPVYRPQPSAYGRPVYRPQPSTYGRPVYRPQPSMYDRLVYRPQPSTYGTAQMPVYRPQHSTYGRPVYRPQPSTYSRPVYRPQPSTYGTAQIPVYRPQPSTYGTAQRPVYRPQPSRQQQEEAASTVELRFICDTLKTPIYTHKTISAFEGQPVEVAIYRNGQVITFGPLSSLNVEIVALPGDFRPEDNLIAEDFDRRIVTSRDGQGSVLEGCYLRTLLNGRQSFDGIRFREGSSRTSMRRFTLAARVVRGQDTGGLRVHEAFMGPVNVKDHRSEANEKSDRPQLNDEVYRLKGIAKNGPYFQMLQKWFIRTVQDFLKAYHGYPQRLRNILEINSHRSKPWETMTTHALDCFLGDTHKLKKYVIEGGNVVLFFNCVHDLVGAEFHGHYFAKEKFDESQKAVVEKRKEQAYNELKGTELDYVMKDGRPTKISTGTNVVHLPHFPMQDAIPQPNPPDQHATYQGADNSGPAEINQHMSQTLPEHVNCNIATLVSGAGGSEPFLPDHHRASAAWENDPSSSAGTFDEILRELDLDGMDQL